MSGRVTIPKGRPTPAPQPRKEEVGPERLLQALQTMDKNAADRMKELKLFLFFLPLLWGVLYGVVYLIIHAGAS